MDGLDLTNPSFLTSHVVGAVVIALASGLWQMYGDKEAEGQVKPKAVIRDAILGGIFTAMAWTLVPESMKQVTDSVSSSVASASAAAAGSVSSAVSSATSGALELQVGPPRF